MDGIGRELEDPEGVLLPEHVVLAVAQGVDERETDVARERVEQRAHEVARLVELGDSDERQAQRCRVPAHLGDPERPAGGPVRGEERLAVLDRGRERLLSGQVERARRLGSHERIAVRVKGERVEGAGQTRVALPGVFGKVERSRDQSRHGLIKSASERDLHVRIDRVRRGRRRLEESRVPTVVASGERLPEAKADVGLVPDLEARDASLKVSDRRADVRGKVGRVERRRERVAGHARARVPGVAVTEHAQDLEPARSSGVDDPVEPAPVEDAARRLELNPGEVGPHVAKAGRGRSRRGRPRAGPSSRGRRRAGRRARRSRGAR